MAVNPLLGPAGAQARGVQGCSISAVEHGASAHPSEQEIMLFSLPTRGSERTACQLLKLHILSWGLGVMMVLVWGSWACS